MTCASLLQEYIQELSELNTEINLETTTISINDLMKVKRVQSCELWVEFQSLRGGSLEITFTVPLNEQAKNKEGMKKERIN